MTDAAIPADPRALAYEVLGQLFLRGLTPVLRAHAAAFTELTAPAAAFADEEAAAVEHQRVLGFEVFPYEGVFLAPESQIGAFDGATLEEVLGPYDSFRQLYRTWPEGSDHIGCELGFLGALCQEAASQPSMAEILPAVCRHFLDHHLLRWLPALALALHRQDSPFYAALSRTALALALHHRQDLFPTPAIPHPRLWSGWPPHEEADAGPLSGLDWLEQPDTGLNDIADFLLAPARSGLYLSRGDLRRLARPDAVPTGFGERRNMLRSLLHEAVAYGSAAPVLQRLLGMVQEAGAFHATQPQAVDWLERLGQTRAVLERMLRQAQASGPSSAKGRERTPAKDAEDGNLLPESP